jgi:hypothetical protein
MFKLGLEPWHPDSCVMYTKAAYFFIPSMHRESIPMLNKELNHQDFDHSEKRQILSRELCCHRNRSTLVS